MNGDLNIHRITQLVPVSDPGGPLKGSAQTDSAILHEHTVIIRGGKITAVHPSQAVTQEDLGTAPTIDGSGYIALPGLVESHSHPLYVGNRSQEYAHRHSGVHATDTHDLASETGGGIARIVDLTRGADPQQLVTRLRNYLVDAVASGVTTLEVKGGYGLTQEDEIAHYALVTSLQGETAVLMSPTFAAAHVVPSDHTERSYVQELDEHIFPAASRANVFERCDITIEEGIFGPESVATLIARVQELGAKLIVHADAFSDSQGWSTAVEAGALSADHLTFTPSEAIRQTQGADTVATVLPMAELVYNTTQKAKAKEFIHANIPLAIATDFSSTIGHTSLFRAMLFSIPWYGLTITETITSATLNAAYSLGLQEDVGSIEPGKRGDLLLIQEDDLDTLAWRRVDGAPDMVIAEGRIISGEQHAHVDL